MKNRALLVILLLGLAVRLAALSMPGTEDMRTNQIWGTFAVEHGITRVYVLEDADYLNKFLLYLRRVPIPTTRVDVQTQLGVLDHVPDYPPLSLYLFWLATWSAKWMGGGRLEAGSLLNALFNALPVLCSLGIVLLTWRFSREQGFPGSTAVVAAFWLNPALILHTPILGYVDAVFGLMGLGSLILAFRRRFTLSVALLALACMTKPQGVLIVPVVAVAIAAERSAPRVWRPCLVFSLTALLPFVPFVVTGHFLAALRGAIQVGGAGSLSSHHLNFWWIVSWVYESVLHPGQRTFAGMVKMLPVAEFPHWFLLDVRVLALLMWIAFAVFNLRWLWQELQRGNRMAIFWVSALQVYGFTMLSLYPKENHLYAFFVYAFPLLFFGNRKLAGLFTALSVIFGLNIYLFDGFGRGMVSTAGEVRSGLGIDLTVLVAFANLAVFAWLVRRERWWFELARPAAPRESVNETRRRG